MSEIINTNMTENEEIGEIKISEEVIQVVAGIAVGEIEGVSVTNSIAEGIVEKFVKRSYGKGIKVNLEENNADIDVHITVDYGVKIPDAAFRLQENVKKAIETFTDITVGKVNVCVDGINMEDESKAKKASKKVAKEEEITEELTAFDKIEEVPEEIDE